MFSKMIIMIFYFLFIISSLSADIKIGLIFDMTGATRDVCRPFVRGIFDSIEYTNNQGGINGKQINTVLRDDRYLAEVAEQAYDEMKSMGIKVIEEIVELDAQEADAQIQSIINQGADYAIIQQTLGATIAIIRSARKYDFRGGLIGLNWAFDEALIPVLLDEAEGVLGFPLFAQWNEDIKGMSIIKNFLEEKYGRVVRQPSKYIAGWTSAQVLIEGLRNVSDFNSGESIKAGMEQIRDYDPDGLCVPISFTKYEHRGQLGAIMYVIKDGMIVPHSDKFYMIE